MAAQTIGGPSNGVAYTFYMSLRSQADSTAMKNTPTLTVGDWKVSIDGGALANLATLPTNTPAASVMVKVALSAAEMTGDNITIVFRNASGAQCFDETINIQTSPAPAVAGVPDVNATKFANQTITAAAGVTLPASVASPTNITAGVITTVTTVTNQLTAAQIATGVWQDTTAGDFTTAASIGKSLFTTGNAPGAASGLALVGSNVGVATSVSGAVGSVTAGVTLAALDSAVVQSGTAQAGGASTITLAAGASATDSLYVGETVMIYGGTGAGQVRVITGYVGATKVATVGRAWTTNPDATSVYKVLGESVPKVNSLLEVTSASVTGAVGSVTGSVGSVTGAVGSIAAGGIATAAFVAGAINNTVVAANQNTASANAVGALTPDGAITLLQSQQILMAALAGQLSGAATTTVTVRDVNNTRNAIVATVDANGNRSAVTLTLV